LITAIFRVLPPSLERADVNIVPLVPFCDAHAYAWHLRTTILCFAEGIVPAPAFAPAFSRSSQRKIAVDIEDALRLNVAALTVQVFIGGEFETRTIQI
jgi:putative autoinducer-2 (AI-2) aldolase